MLTPHSGAPSAIRAADGPPGARSTVQGGAQDSVQAYEAAAEPPAARIVGSFPAAAAPAVAEEAAAEPPRAEPLSREVPVAPPPIPAAPGARVLASYFGPGLFGRTTACGHVLTTALLGVADRALPCGTPVTLQYGGAVVTIPVVDRGPYVYSRQFDLTYATKIALGCPDVCSLTWVR